jgi:hypothetical protein
MSEQESFDALTDIQKEKMLVAPEGDSGRLVVRLGGLEPPTKSDETLCPWSRTWPYRLPQGKRGFDDEVLCYT